MSSETSAEFVNSLRVRPGVITVGETVPGDTLEFRVEVPEVWDCVRVAAMSTELVRAVKLYALDVLCPGTLFPDDYSVKLGGREVLDESMTLGGLGVKNASTLLVTHRRRRPIRS